MQKDLFKVFLLFQLLFCTAAQAHLEDAGYNLNPSTNSFYSPHNLEWLQWDVTAGLSISEALAIYSSDGWRLASNGEMIQLINDTGFNFTYDPNDDFQNGNETLYPGDHNPYDDLLSFTGWTQNDISQNPTDRIEFYSYALYQRADGSNFNYLIFGIDSYYYDSGDLNFTAGKLSINQNDNTIDNDWNHPYYGVALVRTVPLPATAWLFLSAITGLLSAKRKLS